MSANLRRRLDALERRRPRQQRVVVVAAWADDGLPLPAGVCLPEEAPEGAAVVPVFSRSDPLIACANG